MVLKREELVDFYLTECGTKAQTPLVCCGFVIIQAAR